MKTPLLAILLIGIAALPATTASLVNSDFGVDAIETGLVPDSSADSCPTVPLGHLMAENLDLCAPRMASAVAAAQVQVPIGIALPSQGRGLNLATLGTTYRCQETPIGVNDGSGSFGSKTCASSGHANTAWIYYCTSGCPTTDGATHVTQSSCGCSDFNFDWEWYVEFASGSPGYQGSDGDWPNHIVQHGVLIGQTILQESQHTIPTGHFETGVTLD
jgi:hypothetical protein